MFITIHLERLENSSGTGFFFNFKSEGVLYLKIIANKHVVNESFITLIRNEEVIQDSFPVTSNTEWYFHSDTDIDLCFCFVNLLKIIRKYSLLQ